MPQEAVAFYPADNTTNTYDHQVDAASFCTPAYYVWFEPHIGVQLQQDRIRATWFTADDRLTTNQNVLNELRERVDFFRTENRAHNTARVLQDPPPHARAVDYVEPTRTAISLEEVSPFHIIISNKRDKLLALEREFSASVRNGSYDQPYHQTNRPTIRNVRRSIERYRNYRMFYETFSTISQPRKRDLLRYLSVEHPADYSMLLRNTTPGNTVHRREVLAKVRGYFQEKAQYLDYRNRLAPQRAEYLRKKAAIELQDDETKEINLQQFIQTLLSWDSVFMVACSKGETDDFSPPRKYLRVWVGLGNIAMSESAVESSYQEAPDMLLAPFITSFDLYKDGNIVFRTKNSGGLCRENRAIGKFFHPHQLNDSPCLGSFGQSVTDAAKQGDLVTIMSLIIAFYSQYNSKDSAGEKAKYYHPSNMYYSGSATDYLSALEVRAFLNDTNNRFCEVNETRFNEMFSQYQAYVAEEQTVKPVFNLPPQCSNCQEYFEGEVTFYYDYRDQLVCPGCWNENYCSTCERHFDDGCGDPENCPHDFD